MTVATFGEPYTGDDHAEFAAWARELREYRIDHANDRPTVMLYDGDWVYRGTVYGEIAGSMNIEVNETGTIQLRLPIDLDDPRRTWAAFWALDEEARGTSNIHVRIEMMGARVCGRMKARNGVTLVRSDKGDEVVIDFLDDIEELKFVHTAGNPWLPISLLQQPKAWMLLAPADTAVLTTLACNLPRLNIVNIDVGEILDLLNPENWTVAGAMDSLLHVWQQSQIVVKPWNALESVAPLSLAVGSIKTSIFEVAAPILEDAELQWDLRRWFDGDPEPWEGAGTWWIRPGTLMVGIVNKSAFREGTSILGNLFTGMSRTIADLTSNYVEDTYDLVTGDPIDVTGYRIPGWLDTVASHPYVVYRDGDITGIETSEFSRSPGGACRINVGGQSMPGVGSRPRGNLGAGADTGITQGQRINLGGHQLWRGRGRGQYRRRHDGWPVRPGRLLPVVRVARRRDRLVPAADLPRFDPGAQLRSIVAAFGEAGLGSLSRNVVDDRHSGVHRGERDGHPRTPSRN